jgi:hypothetical protein
MARPAFKIDQARQDAFIEALEKTGCARDSAKVASPHSPDGAWSSFYSLKRTSVEFAGRWARALEIASENLILEARRRACQGVKQPVFQRGEMVGEITVYSDRLLEVLLKNLPEFSALRERSVTHQGVIGLARNDAHVISLDMLDTLEESDRRELLRLMGVLVERRRALPKPTEQHNEPLEVQFTEVLDI